jgi:hypothetical protein
LFTQTRQQALGNAEVAFSSANLDRCFAADLSGLRTFGAWA